MAHKKVARRSMTELDWIILRSKKIKEAILEKSFPIENWIVREGRQVGELEFEYFTDDYKAINDGDHYFTPDGSVFLKNEITITDDQKNDEIWFRLKTAAEMIIKVNGKWAGGIDPNRNRVLIKKSEDKTTKFLIEIEGYNRSKPDDERNLETSFLRGCRQVFDSGNLVVINKKVEALSYDINILIDTINSEFTSDFLRDHIIKELNIALNMIDTTNNEFAKDKALIEKIRTYIENNVFKNKTYGKSGKVALVSHSHLDIAYYWRKIHTIQKNARTCLIQLKLMEEYPEFKYSHSQAYTYETLEKYYPEIFKDLQKKVEDGSFEIVGGMYIEPDCNLPSAESLVRQCMYGQHYFREKFNKTISNCWLPDVFGNSWILPQILKKSKMDYFVSNKMSTWNDTNKFPHNSFKWKGIDGSEVYASVPPTHFISWNTPEQVSENWNDYQDKESCEETLSMFGFGDGGSGATRDMLEYMKRLEHIPEVPETRHITADQYLEENLMDNNELETWDGELYLEMHRGTFTTKGNLKRSNRELEILLKDCELLSTHAYLKGMEYPEKRIDEIWKKLLINQFHDILTGTHVTPAGKDAVNDYKSVKEEGEAILGEAIDYLGSKKEEGSLNVLNTLSFKRTGEVFIPGDYSKETKIKDLNVQIGTRKEEKGLWVDAGEINSLSTTKFKLEKVISETKSDEEWFNFDSSSNILNTPHYKVSFAKDSSITSLIRKSDSREIVKDNESLNKLRIYHDYPGMYDAWDILENYKDKENEVSILEDLKVVESGNIYVTLEAKLKTGKSTFVTRVRLFKDSNKIDFEYSVGWYEKNRLSKLEFNLNLLARHSKCDTSAGIITRETHKNTSWQKAKFEVVGHKWVDLSENGFGVSILNDGKYGYSFEPDQIGISLLKGPIRPDPHSDMGKHSFMFSLIPHDGTVENARVDEEALALNTPLINLGTKNFDINSLEIEDSNLVIQSIKKPQYSKDKEFILRVVELKGKRGTGKVLSKLTIKSIEEVDLLEDIEEIQDTVFNENEIKFNYKPFEIKSFKITLK